MDNEQLSGWAGGISGFADALQSGMKANAEREDAKNKFAAYMELQREMMGNKTVTGQELFDYGVTMGIPADQLSPLDLGKKYNITLGKAWVDNLNAQKITDTKEKGANKRAGAAAEAKVKAAGAGKSEANASFKPEVASAKALNNALVREGYPVGTKLEAIKDKAKLDAIAAAYLEDMGGSIQAAKQQDFIEAVSPFEVGNEKTFWGGDRPTVTARPGYRSKVAQAAAQAAPPQQPAPGAVPRPAAPMPAAVATPQAVGGDKKAAQDAFRARLGLKPKSAITN